MIAEGKNKGLSALKYLTHPGLKFPLENPSLQCKHVARWKCYIELASDSWDPTENVDP